MLRTIGNILLIVCAIGWFGGAIIAGGEGSRVPWWIEFPLGYLKGVAVDREGRIYCGLQSYNHVQVYDFHGRFLRGWHIDAGGGEFRIRMNSNNQLEVATARGSKFFVFDPNGTLIDHRSNVDRIYNRFGDEGETLTTGSDGTIYQLSFASITKVEPSGHETAVVYTPFYKWPLYLLMFPLPAWLLGILGYVMRGIAASRGG